MVNDKIREIIKNVYREIEWSEYYIDHPDSIKDFHGKCLKECVLVTIEETLNFLNEKIKERYDKIKNNIRIKSDWRGDLDLFYNELNIIIKEMQNGK